MNQATATAGAPMVCRHERNFGAGAVGGLVGGVVFGVMLQMIGMMPMIAKLVGASSAGVGWLVHLVISAIIGLSFTWWFGTRACSAKCGAEYGLLHGLIWWILGPLVIMPLGLGMGVQFAAALTKPMLLSLVGHLVYGLIAGLVYVGLTKPHQV